MRLESVRSPEPAIAVIGLGRMGAIHATNLREHVGFGRLVSVVDTAEAVARRVGEELDVPWTTSVDDVIADPRIQAIVIASPPATHTSVIRAAAVHGKHIFCEKPLSYDPDDCRLAVGACTEAGVHLQIGFQMRFDPDLSEVKRRIDAGDLGDVYLFRSSLRDLEAPSRQVLEGTAGLVNEGAVHTFDLARWLVGEVAEVSALGAALSDPIYKELDDHDHLVIALRFASGALGALDNSRVSGYGFDTATEVMGSKATVRIAAKNAHFVEWIGAGHTVRYPVDFAARFRSAYVRELEAFTRSISANVPPTPNGEDGFAAAALCRATELAIAERRAVDVIAASRASSEPPPVIN